MAKIYIKPQYVDILQNIFKTHCPHATIWAYGSRITDNASTVHDGSDLDLAIDGLENCKVSIEELRQTIKDSNIPFLIDIFEILALPQSFQTEIVKKRVQIFPNFEGEYA